MTKAAAVLGIPQSSMSRRIHGLEATLGAPLLVQDGRAVRPTPGAVELAHRVRGPLAEIDAAVESLASNADPDGGTVAFGFPLTMGFGLVPDLLAAFHYRYPRIRLRIEQAHGVKLVEALRSGDLDLAITIPAPDDLPSIELGTQRIMAVVPDDHRLARLRSVDLDQLSGETFIANPESYNLRQVTESWCRAAGFTPDIAFEITEFATIREFVGRGQGVALLPHDGRDMSGVVEIPLRGNGRHRTIALVGATATRTPAATRLYEFLRSEFA